MKHLVAPFLKTMALWSVVILAALSSIGCAALDEAVTDTVKASACGMTENVTFTLPTDSDCYRIDKADDGCVLTSERVDACRVPEQSDPMLFGGDQIHYWCSVWRGDETKALVYLPADCATGEYL